MTRSTTISCLLLAIFTTILLLSACSQSEKPTLETGDELVAKGQEVFRKNCTICHSLTPGKVITGPSLSGVASRAETRIDGFEARDYIYQSITDPDAYVVDGFPNLMPPNFLAKLKPEEIDAVIAFLLTQK